jgi:hypothetical protein
MASIQMASIQMAFVHPKYPLMRDLQLVHKESLLHYLIRLLDPIFKLRTVLSKLLIFKLTRAVAWTIKVLQLQGKLQIVA